CPGASATFPGGDASKLVILRWVDVLAGISWIGLLYFFNLVNVPFMKEMDAASKAKIIPSMMSRALWWFRWGAVVTVLVGLAYWGKIVGVDADNGRGAGHAGASAGHVMGRFFLIWTIVFLVMYVAIMVVKVNKGPVLAVIVAVVVRSEE